MRLFSILAFLISAGLFISDSAEAGLFFRRGRGLFPNIGRVRGGGRRGGCGSCRGGCGGGMCGSGQGSGGGCSGGACNSDSQHGGGPSAQDSAQAIRPVSEDDSAVAAPALDGGLNTDDADAKARFSREQQQQREDLAAGKKIFEGSCQDCHSEKLEETRSGKPLPAIEDWKVAEWERAIEAVEKGEMPKNKKLEEEEKKQILSYLKSQKIMSTILADSPKPAAETPNPAATPVPASSPAAAPAAASVGPTSTGSSAGSTPPAVPEYLESAFRAQASRDLDTESGGKLSEASPEKLDELVKKYLPTTSEASPGESPEDAYKNKEKRILVRDEVNRRAAAMATDLFRNPAKLVAPLQKAWRDATTTDLSRNIREAVSGPAAMKREMKQGLREALKEITPFSSSTPALQKFSKVPREKLEARRTELEKGAELSVGDQVELQDIRQELEKREARTKAFKRRVQAANDSIAQIASDARSQLETVGAQGSRALASMMDIGGGMIRAHQEELVRKTKSLIMLPSGRATVGDLFSASVPLEEGKPLTLEQIQRRPAYEVVANAPLVEDGGKESFMPHTILKQFKTEKYFCAVPRASGVLPVMVPVKKEGDKWVRDKTRESIWVW